jgi:N-acetylglucosamine kinase-like BadF-type ATPase
MHEPSTGRLFAGVDGGQTSTVALVADAGGAILGHGSSGPCDEIGETGDSRRLADAVEGAVRAALLDAGLDPGAEFETVVAGLSGYEGRLTGAAPRLRANRVHLMNDVRIALAGAIEGPGIVLIAGTGSVAYGEDASGRSARAGGWGYLFGDRGSAFWIARSALSEAMRAFDSAQTNALSEAALAHFGATDLRALARDFYSGEISRAQLAGFAAVVAQAAKGGDPRARAVVDHGAIALAKLASRVKRRLDFAARARVALYGGAFSDEALRAATERALGADSAFEVVAAESSGAVGALRLAYRDAGLTVAPIAAAG